MDRTERAVIERLVDSLQVVNNFLKLAENNLGVEPSGDYDAPLIAEARKLLEDDGWIRVEDALPVVPEGKSHVTIWCGNSVKGEIWRSTFLPDGKVHRQATHWQMYITPQPPKDAK